jgi:hypothetical protein
MAKFVTPKSRGASFVTTTAKTGITQRESLEAIIVNLCDHLGIEIIYKRQSARGSYFYCTEVDRGSYQSATNTILSLTEKL